MYPIVKNKLEQSKELLGTVTGTETWLLLSAKRKLESSMTALGKQASGESMNSGKDI